MGKHKMRYALVKIIHAENWIVHSKTFPKLLYIPGTSTKHITIWDMSENVCQSLLGFLYGTEI